MKAVQMNPIKHIKNGSSLDVTNDIFFDLFFAGKEKVQLINIIAQESEREINENVCIKD